MSAHKIQLGNGVFSPSADSPFKTNGTPSSGGYTPHPLDSGCRVESSDEETPGKRSQRRHFHDFNRSSVFDFMKPEPQQHTPEVRPAAEDPSDSDKEINQEHKQKRHYVNKNQSTIEL